MPNKDFKLKGTIWEKIEKCTVVVYADLEALNIPANVKKVTKTLSIEKQYPASYGAILVECEQTLVAETYCGKDYQ